MLKLPTIFCLLLIAINGMAQQDYYDAYVATYEDGPGSTVLNMSLVEQAPLASQPFIVVTGPVYLNHCREDGLPKKEIFDSLYYVEDVTLGVLNQFTKVKHAGTFSYQCERINYYYVEDTTGVRDSLLLLYQTHFSNFGFYLDIKADPKWEAYLTFLYPNADMLDQMTNRRLVEYMQQQGDPLSKARPVDHWLYFKNKISRQQFENQIRKAGYAIEAKSEREDANLPYQLQISRSQGLTLAAINETTAQLRRLAAELGGEYDGWEAPLVAD